MKAKSILLFMVLIGFLPAKAQKFEMGKVSLEELQEKQHPQDPDAVAAVLFEKGETYFDYTDDRGFVLNTKVRTRIKIYKKEGYEWANFEKRYYLQNDGRETVVISDAVTYNLEAGKIVKSKLKNDGEFDEKLNKYWGKKKITMPNVKEGSVIEYEYLFSTSNIVELEDWNFQSSIPINYSEYKTEFPEYFTYRSNQRGYLSPKITTENVPKSYIFTGREGGMNGEKSTFTQNKIDYVAARTTYLVQNAPAMKDEAFVNNILNYMSGISHELSVIKYPNSPIKYLSTDWETVTKKIYDNEDFGAELNKTGYFDDDINALLSGVTAPNDKIGLIFDYVKQNVKWNDFYGYSCHDGVRQAYKNKTGNVAEINLMLTAMLRYAGINANPVLVSTRSNGISFFPSRTAFNYVICAVEVNDGLVLLDATEKYAVPNVLPVRDINWFGRLIRKNGTSSQVSLTPTALSKDMTNIIAKVDDKGEINGKIRKHFTDYNALNFRQRYLGINTDSYLESLENKNDKIEISDYIRENEKELTKPIVETYNFKDANDADIIGDKMYIAPMLFMRSKSNPFKQEVREYPVDFVFPMEDKYNITIEIPEGYAVESVPEPISLAMADGLGIFKFIIGVNDKKIQASITIDINTAIIGAENYLTLKDFFQKMTEKENEKIVLKKI